ncbi:hypothetical protein CcCBS67573_g10272 [Chytriomyces confervae]|uniref:Uncharacterized protein n=1 Tax=Chytriomyces confervae TaxID=246404 RepID=A0A507D6T0_9FUNG|nr:hypothetical protein CcCBS67573_g10272 [Chytriomyces confervae]
MQDMSNMTEQQWLHSLNISSNPFQTVLGMPREGSTGFCRWLRKSSSKIALRWERGYPERTDC